METKKISFGFSKINKKPNLLPPKQIAQEVSKVELIKCLEGHEIKLVVEEQEKAPLVIPMKENQKTSTALASLLKRRAVLLGEDEITDDKANAQETTDKVLENAVADTAEDLEKRAAKELLAEVKGQQGMGDESNLVLPILKPDELPLDGAKESTLDDYDSIPIQHFGIAMLRGMGWVEPPKKKGGPAVDESPMVRPKGMGLGADKALKPKPLLVQPEKNEVLEIRKQAYVRILGGKHKDLYGQIEGFDDHAGRVIVKLAIGGAKEAFNEFLCQPVSKKEYSQYGKCINTAKYEEYKKMENEYGQIVVNGKGSEQKIKKEKDDKSDIKKEYADRTNVKTEIKTERLYDEKKYIKQEKVDKYGANDNDYKQRRNEERYERKRDNSEERYIKAENRGNERSDRYNETRRHDRYNDYEKTKYIDDSKHSSRVESSKSRRSRSRELSSRSHNAPSTSRSRRSPTPKEKSSSDDSASSEDSDSAYERKQKKTKHKSKSKHKKKKSKSKSNKQRRASSSDGVQTTDSDGDNSEVERRSRRNSSKFKKKTKKSKRERSRSRSRGRR